MTEPSMPDGFWEWLAEQDPERVPFRAHMSDTTLASLIEYAEARTAEESRISLAEFMEEAQ